MQVKICKKEMKNLEQIYDKRVVLNEISKGNERVLVSLLYSLVMSMTAKSKKMCFVSDIKLNKI